MGRNDEMKLLLATFRLENNAACWWKMIDSKWIAAQTVRTWELFKTEFNKNYIPQSVKLKKEAEFRSFEQGNLMAQQYATKFTSLAKHASYLVEGEDKKATKFQDESIRPQYHLHIFQSVVGVFCQKNLVLCQPFVPIKRREIRVNRRSKNKLKS
ncbi:hypothetical protein RJ640_022447 [Escallonia rubra]|uniref:Retrotransposon gag domain-containing protein n=1 Tax=Escallonia rubra TaxID=112253 RepID=A0AA88QLZ3_9ASTE|nr:hypothetical protein RJ640_022447 [Escallonia rubra]